MTCPNSVPQVASENYEEFLKALNVGFMLRKAAVASTPVMTITEEGGKYTMVTKTTMIITPTMPMSASPQAMTLLLPNPVMALPHPHLHLAMALLHPHLAMALPLPNPAMTLLQQVMIPLQQVCVSTNSAIISNFSYRLGNLRYFGVTRVWRKFYSFFTMKTTYKETGNVSTDHHVSLVPRGI